MALRAPTSFMRLSSSARQGALVRAPFGRAHCARQSSAARRNVAAEAIGIFFSTSTGKTEDVAGIIKEKLGDAADEPKDIGDIEDLATLSSYDGLIVGAPTWNTGADTERSGTAWDNKLEEIAALKLKGLPVAVFGLGDQISYGDYYCDAMEELYTNFKKGGATMVGKWPTKGYEHSESKAEIEKGFFCGLALDEDNQDDQTESRVATWCQQVKAEMAAKVKA